MRPYVICHMMSSLDGKTDSHSIEKFANTEIFEETHPLLGGDAWLCGRVTIQVNFSEYADPTPFANDGSDPVGTDQVHVARAAESWAIGADTGGQILWTGKSIAGDEPIALVSQKASKRYLETLRERGISYIVAGKNGIDFPKAFEALAKHFGVKRLIVEGGGMANGAILDAGLIDEFSLLLMPGVDGRKGLSSTFDGRPVNPVSSFPATLQSIERLENDVLWLRYRLKGKAE